MPSIEHPARQCLFGHTISNRNHMLQKVGFVVERSKLINLIAFSFSNKRWVTKTILKFTEQPRFYLGFFFSPSLQVEVAAFTRPHLKEDVDSLRNQIINKMISLVQAIKHKTSSDSNTASTEDSGKEVSPKASDNEDF